MYLEMSRLVETRTKGINNLKEKAVGMEFKEMSDYAIGLTYQAGVTYNRLERTFSAHARKKIRSKSTPVA